MKMKKVRYLELPGMFEAEDIELEVQSELDSISQHGEILSLQVSSREPQGRLMITILYEVTPATAVSNLSASVSSTAGLQS